MVFNVYLRLTSATWSLSTILPSFFPFFLKYFQFSIKLYASSAWRVSSTQILDIYNTHHIVFSEKLIFPLDH